MKEKKIILTTSDYPPQLGGLSTFSVNVEKVLNSMGYQVEIFHWKKLLDIKKIKLDETGYVVNINPMVSKMINFEKQINFFHGSEILFYSPVFWKRIVKRVLKSAYLKSFEKNYRNIFISNYTYSILQSLGYKVNYAKDLVFHNCIEINAEEKNITPIDDILEFVCIARDVPHKNIDGCIRYCELLSKKIDQKIILNITTQRDIKSQEIQINNYKNLSDLEREEIYKRSHYNLLLSLNHEDKGFFEGFGLTILEAGKYGTPSIVSGNGGLSESVHDGATGWVLNEKIDPVKLIENYEIIANNCFNHTHGSHNLGLYKKLFEVML